MKVKELVADGEADVSDVEITDRQIGIATPKPRWVPVVILRGLGC